MEKVIIVDAKDNEIGQMEKLKAHKVGALHRAFSILVFNRHGELLLQKRAPNKYHSGGLWTNTCCSHPRPGELTKQAAERRLFEEMGISAALQYAYKFIYKTDLGDGLIEHECDHVFIAQFDGEPKINADEASDWKYMSIPDIKNDLIENPTRYTFWFKIIMESIEKHIPLN